MYRPDLHELSDGGSWVTVAPYKVKKEGSLLRGLINADAQHTPEVREEAQRGKEKFVKIF